jgi:hypothetical protein
MSYENYDPRRDYFFGDCQWPPQMRYGTLRASFQKRDLSGPGLDWQIRVKLRQKLGYVRAFTETSQCDTQTLGDEPLST